MEHLLFSDSQIIVLCTADHPGNVLNQRLQYHDLNSLQYIDNIRYKAGIDIIYFSYL